MGRHLLVIFLLPSFAANAQLEVLDSLQKELWQSSSEEKKIDLLNQRSFIYTKISVERSEAEAAEALRRANAIGYSKGIADGYSAAELDQVVKEINKKLGTLS